MSFSAMKQALDDICGAKLCEINSMSSRAEMIRLMDKAITALQEAIAEAEKQPVHASDILQERVDETAKDRHEWVGLTDEERKQVRSSAGYNQFMTAGEYAEKVQWATEAKLKEKNT